MHGFFVAAGFCAHGIAGAGGVGRVMAEWILDGEPSFDTWRMDIRRFGAQYRSRELTLARSVEVYSTYYDIHYPNEERHAGRPLRRSPAYERLAALGCAFGEKSMWERPNWFEPNAAARRRARCARAAGPASTGARRSSPRRSPAGTPPRCSTRPASRSSRSPGPGAVAFLNRVCANEMDQPIGSVIYTQLCNERGGIECDLTATRLDASATCSSPAPRSASTTSGGCASSRSCSPRATRSPPSTSRRATRASASGDRGPRDILAPLTTRGPRQRRVPVPDRAADLRSGASRSIALRVTYVGELGWELYCPSEYGAALWDELWEAGAPHGMLAGGYRAIDALRVEKGYRVWSSDITPEDNPYQAGLGFAVKLDKASDFVGRDALRAVKDDGIDRRLRCVRLADPLAVPLGSEPVRVDGEIVGRVTSGGSGFRVGRGDRVRVPPRGPGRDRSAGRDRGVR